MLKRTFNKQLDADGVIRFVPDCEDKKGPSGPRMTRCEGCNGLVLLGSGHKAADRVLRCPQCHRLPAITKA